MIDSAAGPVGPAETAAGEDSPVDLTDGVSEADLSSGSDLSR